MTPPPEIAERAVAYCNERGIEIDIRDQLGDGQDGFVFKSKVPTAIKASLRWSNYYTERRCYERLKEKGVREIEGLVVPRLIGFSDELQVIEIDVVMPPCLIDFGKAYIDERSPYTPEQLAEWHEELKEIFDDDYRVVRKVLASLWAYYGIDYTDAKPKNIWFRNDEL